MKQSQTYVTCNLCGADEFTILFNEGKAQVHRIVQCRKCSLIYANPQKDNVSDVEKEHAVDINNSEDAINQYNPENHKYLKKQFLQLRDYKKIIDFVDKENKGIFLEIGSYAGVFLNEAKKLGWNVLGIEPLEIPALFAEEKFKISVIREYFEKADLKDNSIDVIVACHVIEHVPDPESFINKAYKCLKPGGKLILETPTYDSLMFKLLKHRERSVKCNGHVFFFTKYTLSKLLENSRFKVLKHEKVGRTLTIDRLFYNLGIITGRKKFFLKLSNFIGLDKIVIRVNMRDMQRIYCQKD